MSKLSITLGAAASLAGAVFLSVPATALASNSNMQDTHMSQSTSKAMKCHMRFKLSGWSAIYETASGKGMVHCANGKSMPVKISVKGGGLSAGKYKLTNAHGTFSGVKNIDDVLGSYATASAHAGAVNSGRAMAMTKGPVSLSVSGHGKGWDIGAGFSSFTISRIK
ncbi:MAG: hypothetical protein ACRER0_04500 [Gammaproteobacteria bacterium]